MESARRWLRLLSKQILRFNLVRAGTTTVLYGASRRTGGASAADGTVVDPSVKQFPTKGAGADYEEFDGNVECEYCGDIVVLDVAYRYEQHAYCSDACFRHDIGF